MIIETRCDPVTVWNEERKAFDYKFNTPMVINTDLIAGARPGFYVPSVGSIISFGGADFGIEYDFASLAKAMKERR